jgi:hypothetical protein
MGGDGRIPDATLILEPIVIYVMLKELPGRGATIGFLLGAAGLFQR